MGNGAYGLPRNGGGSASAAPIDAALARKSRREILPELLTSRDLLDHAVHEVRLLSLVSVAKQTIA
jgi:hypothetical protein